MYLYTNGHVLIPRYYAGLYGSFFKKFEIEEDISYFMKYYIRKNKVLKISREGEMCTEDGDAESIGRCIVGYLENVHKCTSYQLMAEKGMPLCTEEKMTEASETLEDWKTLPESDIFNVTRCLPICERNEIFLDPIKEVQSRNQTNATLTIVLEFEDGSYKLQEEYMSYDIGTSINGAFIHFGLGQFLPEGTPRLPKG